MKRVLLDENLPKQLKRYFSSDFEVTSVPDLGWQSKKNGELLTSMDAENIGYLVTADRNLRFQQNLEKYSVVVVVVSSFGAAIGGRITGYLADQNAGDYTQAFYGVTLAAALAFITSIAIYFLSRGR